MECANEVTCHPKPSHFQAFWFSGCWRALAKGTAWAGLLCNSSSSSCGVLASFGLALHRALRRMAGLVFLLVFWVLASACQRHGVGGFIVQFIIITCVILRLMSPHRRQKKDLNIYIYNTPSLFTFLLLLLRSATQAHLDLALFLKPARISSATAPKQKETDQKRRKIVHSAAREHHT